MSIRTIRNILGGRRLHCVSPEDTVRSVGRVMAENRVGAVAVLDGQTLVGIVSERDIVFRGIAGDLTVDCATAAQIMTRDPVTVDIDNAISDALAARLGDAFRHVPVVENGRVVGLLSYRDIPPEYLMMFERFREMTSAHAHDA